MKRILALTILSLASLYYYYRPEQTVNNWDAVKLKMSSVKRLPTAVTKRLVITEAPAIVVEEEADEILDEHMDEESQVSDEAEVAEVHTDEDELDNSEVPWEELKNGWREHLQTQLLDLDVENGEDIYNAYLSENNAYEAEMAKLEMSSSDDVQTMMGQLETRHEEKLKEILGKHYEYVTDQHQQYNSSIQHSNRSGKYEVGVSL